MVHVRVLPSLVPRPSPAPVFDRLQYAKTEGEGLGTRLVLPAFMSIVEAIGFSNRRHQQGVVSEREQQS